MKQEVALALPQVHHLEEAERRVSLIATTFDTVLSYIWGRVTSLLTTREIYI